MQRDLQEINIRSLLGLEQDSNGNIVEYLSDLLSPKIIRTDYTARLQMIDEIDDLVVIEIQHEYMLRKQSSRPVKCTIYIGLNEYPVIIDKGLPSLDEVQIGDEIINIDKYMDNGKFEYTIEVDNPIRVLMRCREVHYYTHGGQMRGDMKHLTRNCSVTLIRTEISDRFEFRCQFASPIPQKEEPDIIGTWRYNGHLLPGQGYVLRWIPKKSNE